jgi:hypothetical protein
MPERAIIALMPAVALGFICGLIASVTQMQDMATLLVGVAGAALVVAAGTTSVLGVRAESGEKVAVGGLRALIGVALFAAIYLFMLSFLRDGNLLAAIVWLILGGIFGILLTRPRVRDRGDSGESGERHQAA